MNYKHIYQALIERARGRILVTHFESHHVIPKCLGGTNDKSNLVNLTLEEHYLAHQLLVKIYPEEHGIISAAMMMTCGRPSNKLYGWLRKRFIESQKTNQLGDKNSQFGTRWVYNNSLKISKKISILEEVPEGWNLGRKLKFSIKKCVHCESPTRTDASIYCQTHHDEVKSENSRKNSIHIRDMSSSSYLNKKFITNEKIDRLHSIFVPVPEGWRWGRSNNKRKY